MEVGTFEESDSFSNDVDDNNPHFEEEDELEHTFRSDS